MKNKNVAAVSVGDVPSMSDRLFSDLVPNEGFSGLCTVLGGETLGVSAPKSASLQLSDVSGRIFGSCELSVGDLPPLPCIAEVAATIHCDEESHLVAVVHEIRPARVFRLRALPIGTFPEAGAAAAGRLWGLYEGLQPHFKQFVDDALSDPEIRRRFFQVPASRRCHHVDEGGLAEHSVTSAEIAQTMASMVLNDRNEIDAAVVVALFHDLGKIGPLRTKVRHPAVSHEDRGLLFLAGALARLSATHPMVHEVVLAALTHRGESGCCPVSRITSDADRLSATISARANAAAQAEDWQSVLKLECGGKGRTFFRPLPAATEHGFSQPAAAMG